MIRRLAAVVAVLAATLAAVSTPTHAATPSGTPDTAVAVSFARPTLYNTPTAAPTATLPAAKPPVARHTLATPHALWALTAAVCKCPRANPPAPPRAVTTASRSTARPAVGTGRVADVMAYALAQVGKPYVWGAAGPNAFDCSGLVVAAYRSIGIALPHFTGDLLGRGTAVSRADLRPGDLVFLSVGHVALVLDSGHMVAAPHSGANVQVQTIYAFYAARRLI